MFLLLQGGAPVPQPSWFIYRPYQLSCKRRAPPCSRIALAKTGEVFPAC